MEVKKEGEATIGIELGLNSSCVCIWRHGRAEVIPNDLGNPTTPSYVAFSETHCFVGDASKTQSSINPSNIIFGFMRLIGRRFDDEDVQRFVKIWPFKIVPRSGSWHGKKPIIIVSHKGEEKEFQAEELSAMILRKLKEVAEANIGTEVKHAVITVPAHFNDLQRQATRDAGILAGLNVKHVISEPTSAAIAYGLDKKAANGERNVLVFNLGREICDISLVKIEKEVFEVKTTCEDSSFGGQNFDNRLVNYFVGEFMRKHGKDISRCPRAMNMLRAACEKAKVMLSSNYKAAIEIDCLFDGIDYTTCITCALFNKLNRDLFEHCVSLVDKCLTDAKVGKEDVHEIVLVGGSSRIPKIQQMLLEFFRNKVELCKTIHPEEVFACGAAAHAAMSFSKHTMDTTNIPLLLKGVDSLLEGFGDSKPIKPFPPRIKHKAEERLRRLNLDFSDTELVKNLVLLLKQVDVYLPEHLRPALKVLEQTLVTCQAQFLERVSEKEATFIDLQEVDSGNAELTASKKRVQSSSSYCDRLKADIADINATIARLIDKRAGLQKDLDSEQLKLENLTGCLATQMESTKKRLKTVTSFQNAEKLLFEARHSLQVAVDCIGSFFASL